MTLSIIKRLAAVATCALIAVLASAYPASNYATSSKLASGHWVKIAIPADGVYQLTESELSQMGFPNINNVQIYGYGGHMLGEELTGNEPNDLQQIPTLLFRDKLCFYAKGPLDITFNVSDDGNYFTRKVNAYSTQGYYFVTEGDDPLRVEQFEWTTSSQPKTLVSSYNWFLHERELVTMSRMGKDLLGESLMDQSCYFDYNLPNIASPDIMMQTSVATSSSSTSSGASYYSVISASLITDGQVIPVNYSATHIPYITAALTKYVQVSPIVGVTLPSLQATGQVKVDKVATRPAGSTAVSIKNCVLDYVLLSYMQNNGLINVEDNQQIMYYPMINAGDIINVRSSSATTQVWNLNGPYPISLGKSSEIGQFSSPLSISMAQFVAFEPAEKLLSITGFEEVPNQNIHGQSTPDFVIVSNKDFMEAAHALASLHNACDGMDVLVVSQEEVFNEFSSGTPDAMAVRLMCKMFYDRDPNKFKYLLMMGQGTFDNRQLATHKPGTVITYETDASYSESYSFASDDFYGILDDGSGRRIAAEYIRLGVGRLTPATADEAMEDVRKIAKYITDPDYGPWRNNALVISDQGDNNTHIYQGQALCNLIKIDKNVLLEQSKAFVPFFPKAVDEDLITEENRSSPASNQYVASALCQGQYFASYIGHASPTGFTGGSKTWRLTDVNNVAYPHLPIMTTACCDVARFDDQTRGIAEYMMHKPDGGAIALLTSSREVDALKNDQLNRAFTNAFFTLNDDGTMPTLGYVNMKAKQSFGTVENRNKMMFVFLGDPAMKVNYPLNRMKVTKINGTNIDGENSTAQVSPMQYLTVEAQVMNEDGSEVDNSFNGDAYVTLYDSERFYTTTTAPHYSIPVDICYPRTQLAQIDAKVVNGVVTAQILVPRDLEGNGNLHLSLYAHKTGNDFMVNGVFDNLAVGPYDETAAVSDTQAPVITSMFFDNADEFLETATTTSNGVLHINAIDETALSVTSSITGEMKLILDGGSESYYLVKNFVSISDGGKSLDITMPFTGLTPGRHNLTYTVMDVAGNSATKSIDFVVEQPTNVVLAVDELPATQQATFYVAKNTLSDLPELTVKVTDVLGNIVWQTTTTSFPCVWDLNGLNGDRVPNGVYRFWATYDDDTYYGGTPKTDLVIVAP